MDITSLSLLPLLIVRKTNATPENGGASNLQATSYDQSKTTTAIPQSPSAPITAPYFPPSLPASNLNLITATSLDPTINTLNAQAKLDLLYDDIASDLIAGKPLVISTTLLLWDAAATGEGYFEDGVTKKSWAIGNNYKHNLYWGAKYGLYTMLSQDQNWKQVLFQNNPSDSQILKVVFARTTAPNKFWQSKGVRIPYTTYLVIDVFSYGNIVQAYNNYAKNLFSDGDETIVLPGSSVPIEAGSKSRIVVFSGHMHAIGSFTLSDYQERATSIYRKATATLSCLSQAVFGNLTISDSVAGLLYTNQMFAPEGYTHLPFYNSIIDGKNAAEILRASSKEYQKYQKIHSSVPNFPFVNEDTIIAP